MSSFLSRLLQRTFRPRAERQQAEARRRLRMELLEGRQMMAGDLGVINGTVYNDLTDNGIDASDPRLSGIQLTLFRDGGNGNFDNGGADDTQVATQTTNAQGFYNFSGLTAGTYFVRQSAASGLIQRPSQTVQQVIVTPAQADGSIGVLLDSFNEGQQIAAARVGGPTPVSNFLAVAGIAGGERDIFADATGGITGDQVEIRVDNENVADLLAFSSDAGTTGVRSVVWDGADGNAVAIDSTTGLGGINLTANGATGFRMKIGTDIASNVILRVFSGPNNASIATVAMPVTPGGLATGTLFIPFSSFTNLNGSGASFTSVRAIQMEFDGAAAADGQVDFIETAGSTAQVVNFANLQPLSLGGTVWRDTNNNSLLDSGESGINNVTLQLYSDTNNNGTIQIGTDTLVGTTTSVSNGTYQFLNLFPGTYLVLIPISQLGTGQPLAGLNPSSVVANPENNVDGDNNGALIAGVGVATTAIVLAAGAESTTDGDTNSNTNLTVDFGFVEPQNTSVDLAITKSSNLNPAIAGQNLTYTLNVVNNGPGTASGIRVIDNLPDGFTVINVSSTSGSQVTGSPLGDVVVDIPSLVSGQSAIVTIVVAVPSSYAISLVNEASVGLINSSGFIDTNLNNNSTTLTTPVERRIDLAVTKTGTPNPLSLGQTLTYTVNFVNDGPSDASQVRIVDNIPDGLKFTTITGTIDGVAIPSSAFTIPATAQDDNAANNDDILIQIGNLTRGTTGSITLTAVILPGIQSSISNVATISTTATGLIEANANNNQATANTTVNASANFVITKVGSPSAVNAGGNLVYTIDVTNNGPADATNVVIADNIPDGIQVLASNVTVTFAGSSTPAVVVPPSASDTIANNPDNITISIPSMVRNSGGTNNPTPGSTARVVITARVLPETRGSLVNQASVAATEAQSSVSSTATTTVNNQVDLAITKIDLADPVVTGSTLSYTLTVTNVGSSTANNVRITDLLPNQLAFVSGSTSTGGSVTNINGTLTANIGTLPPGGSATVTINTTVQSTTPGIITNTATVAADEVDSNTSNNSATATTTLESLRVISGKVFLDQNYSRTLDGGDPGIPSVGLTLFRLDGGNRTQVAQTNSDSAGNYQFGGLTRGAYEIEQNASNRTFQGSPIVDGTQDLPGFGGTLIANNRIRVDITSADSPNNNFLWYQVSWYLCGDDAPAFV
ncbi:MAG: SdrD B-like domain-containing protein [Pirellulaceae bacterium]|jgi:uncharacterized repeat protein (TIGR01451 family)